MSPFQTTFTARRERQTLRKLSATNSEHASVRAAGSATERALTTPSWLKLGLGTPCRWYTHGTRHNNAAQPPYRCAFAFIVWTRSIRSCRMRRASRATALTTRVIWRTLHASTTHTGTPVERISETKGSSHSKAIPSVNREQSRVFWLLGIKSLHHPLR